MNKIIKLTSLLFVVSCFKMSNLQPLSKTNEMTEEKAAKVIQTAWRSNLKHIKRELEQKPHFYDFYDKEYSLPLLKIYKRSRDLNSSTPLMPNNLIFGLSKDMNCIVNSLLVGLTPVERIAWRAIQNGSAKGFDGNLVRMIREAFAERIINLDMDKILLTEL